MCEMCWARYGANKILGMNGQEFFICDECLRAFTKQDEKKKLATELLIILIW